MISKLYWLINNTGLIRQFRSIDCSANQKSIYAGNTAGEMIYHRKSGVFRAAVPVCRAGVEVLCVISNQTDCLLNAKQH